jgi:hypothetical protein
LDQHFGLLKKSFDNIYNECYQQAENDHGGKWKIKTKITFFNSYITGQTADPVQFIMKEINDNSNQDDEYANNNNPFSGIAVHSTKIGLNNVHEYSCNSGCFQQKPFKKRKAP